MRPKYFSFECGHMVEHTVTYNVSVENKEIKLAIFIWVCCCFFSCYTELLMNRAPQNQVSTKLCLPFILVGKASSFLLFFYMNYNVIIFVKELSRLAFAD